MNKKNAIILILVVVTVMIIGLLWFYFYSSNQPKPVVTTAGDTGALPFGNTPSNVTQVNKPATSSPVYQQPVGQIVQLRQIYSSPTSGATIFIKNGISKIRFVDRTTGNVQEASPDSTEIIRITNTTIPKIQETIWAPTGDNLIMRYLDDSTGLISSFSGKIKISSSSSNEFLGEIAGSFLSSNADSVVVNPSGDKAFALIKKTDGNGSYGVMSSIDGTNKKQTFNSQVSNWLVSWPNNSKISFTTKPTFKNPGFLYFFNTGTNAMDRVMGDKYGLTTLIKKDLSGVAYSESLRGSARLSYYDIKSGNDKSLDVSTLSDKCVWANTDNNTLYCAVPKNIPASSYPDVWYQGVASFSDNFWKINVDTGTTNMIYETGKNDTADVDAMDLRISPDDKYLVFTNKDNLSLWGLKVQ